MVDAVEEVEVPDFDSAAIPTPIAAMIMITITTMAIVETAVLWRSINLSSWQETCTAVIYAKTVYLPYRIAVSF